ncbi:hypothetical protein DFJ73DRAFT_805550 [Zopfochytrium polystomum]|nr:hypothetical protein DFJ73DRAFT_805550 [Zopfochytrium polystomum]
MASSAPSPPSSSSSFSRSANAATPATPISPMGGGSGPAAGWLTHLSILVVGGAARVGNNGNSNGSARTTVKQPLQHLATEARSESVPPRDTSPKRSTTQHNNATGTSGHQPYAYAEHRRSPQLVRRLPPTESVYSPPAQHRSFSASPSSMARRQSKPQYQEHLDDQASSMKPTTPTLLTFPTSTAPSASVTSASQGPVDALASSPQHTKATPPPQPLPYSAPLHNFSQHPQRQQNHNPQKYNNAPRQPQEPASPVDPPPTPTTAQTVRQEPYELRPYLPTLEAFHTAQFILPHNPAYTAPFSPPPPPPANAYAQRQSPVPLPLAAALAHSSQLSRGEMAALSVVSQTTTPGGVGSWNDSDRGRELALAEERDRQNRQRIVVTVYEIGGDPAVMSSLLRPSSSSPSASSTTCLVSTVTNPCTGNVSGTPVSPALNFPQKYSFSCSATVASVDAVMLVVFRRVAEAKGKLPGELPAVLVGTMVDTVNEKRKRQVSTDMGRSFASLLNVPFFETTACAPLSVNHIFRTLIDVVQDRAFANVAAWKARQIAQTTTANEEGGIFFGPSATAAVSALRQVEADGASSAIGSRSPAREGTAISPTPSIREAVQQQITGVASASSSSNGWNWLRPGSRNGHTGALSQVSIGLGLPSTIGSISRRRQSQSRRPSESTFGGTSLPPSAATSRTTSFGSAALSPTLSTASLSSAADSSSERFGSGFTHRTSFMGTVERAQEFLRKRQTVTQPCRPSIAGPIRAPDATAKCCVPRSLDLPPPKPGTLRFRRDLIYRAILAERNGLRSPVALSTPSGSTWSTSTSPRASTQAPPPPSSVNPLLAGSSIHGTLGRRRAVGTPLPAFHSTSPRLSAAPAFPSMLSPATPTGLETSPAQSGGVLTRKPQLDRSSQPHNHHHHAYPLCAICAKDIPRTPPPIPPQSARWSSLMTPAGSTRDVATEGRRDGVRPLTGAGSVIKEEHDPTASVLLEAAGFDVSELEGDDRHRRAGSEGSLDSKKGRPSEGLGKLETTGLKAVGQKAVVSAGAVTPPRHTRIDRITMGESETPAAAMAPRNLITPPRRSSLVQFQSVSPVKSPPKPPPSPPQPSHLGSHRQSPQLRKSPVSERTQERDPPTRTRVHPREDGTGTVRLLRSLEGMKDDLDAMLAEAAGAQMLARTGRSSSESSDRTVTATTGGTLPHEDLCSITPSHAPVAHTRTPSPLPMPAHESPQQTQHSATVGQVVKVDSVQEQSGGVDSSGGPSPAEWDAVEMYADIDGDEVAVFHDESDDKEDALTPRGGDAPSRVAHVPPITPDSTSGRTLPSAAQLVRKLLATMSDAEVLDPHRLEQQHNREATTNPVDDVRTEAAASTCAAAAAEEKACV